jgi:hypothetical protein
MATHTPPPYFPQGSLAPPDKNRYRKFKLAMVAIAIVVLSAIGALGYAVWYLASRMF